MKYRVAKRIRNETTDCPHGFSCITTGLCGDHALCAVASSGGSRCLTLESHTCVLDCSYRVPLGRRQVCTCPVRAEIHRKYGQ